MLALNQLEVWNRIKDEVNKVGITKNLLQYKKKLENQKKPIKSKKKIKQIGNSLNFRHLWNLSKCWGLETS